MFLLELIYFLAMKKEEVTWKCGADFSLCCDSRASRSVCVWRGRGMRGGRAGRGTWSPGLAMTVSSGCKWWKANASWNPHSDVGFLLCTQRKKYIYNGSSCGLWLRWITNLQPLVFGEKQTVLFWGKNQEPKIIQAFLFIRPEWGQKSISLCALSPFNDEFLTICTNKYGLVCAHPYTEEERRVKGF